jgi:O-antigen ligase/polysaccharide polymerase Wzy-like membrane protein
MPLSGNSKSWPIRKIAAPPLALDGSVARTRLLDRILTSVLIALIVFTPLAIGSVHRWAFTVMEVAVFSLLVLWSFRVTLGVRSPSQPVTRVRKINSIPPQSLLPPATILAALILLQVVPLPPFLVRFLSPSTYHLFIHALPGWPQTTPHLSDFGFAGNWRPLSIAPSLSESALLKYAGYMGLFFLLLAYPFADGAAGESRFYRSVLTTVILTGLLVAAIGLAERVYWNGKILWFVVPQDWGGPWVGAFPRATGPFVNPDHFANYLAMAFPLALATVFRGLPAASPQQSIPFRLMAGFAALLILLAIVLSQSRAAWIGAFAALAFVPLFFFASWREPAPSPDRSRIFRVSRTSTGIASRSFSTRNSATGHRRLLFNGSRTATVTASLTIILTLVLLTLFIMGPGGRGQTGLRVDDTLGGGDIAARATVWNDTLRMISDFPLLGVGLGSWPEIFPRYQSGPWSRCFFVRLITTICNSLPRLDWSVSLRWFGSATW